MKNERNDAKNNAWGSASSFFLSEAHVVVIICSFFISFSVKIRGFVYDKNSRNLLSSKVAGAKKWIYNDFLGISSMRMRGL